MNTSMTIPLQKRTAPGNVLQPMTFVLDNGLVVWLIERHDLPLIVFNLILAVGSDRDPLQKRGLATMTAEALDAGAAGLSALELADQLDFLGARLGKRGEHENTSFLLSTLQIHAGEALDIFASLLCSPTFPTEEFERLRRQRITAIAQQQQQGSFVASSVFHRTLYGGEHPYGTEPRGEPESLQGLQREDLAQFHRRWYHPGNATLIVVGDVTPETLHELLTPRLCSWQIQGEAERVDLPAPSPFPQRLFLVNRPGSRQVDLRVGIPALQRNTPDFFAALVLNRILGGQFSSRLNTNLREKRGLTYGVWSAFSYRRTAGPFAVGGAFHTEGVGLAAREILAEIAAIRSAGVTEEELSLAKSSLTGGFILRFETPSQIAHAFEPIVLFDLPPDYFAHYVEALNEVSSADVQGLAERYLDPQRMKIVAVGEVSEMQKTLEVLELGEPALVDLQGNLIG